MAWEISMTTEGWESVREALRNPRKWSKRKLVNALCDDRFEMVLHKGGEKHAVRAAAAQRKRLNALPHDALADLAMDSIESNNTCDNGGWAVWIDREGCWTVPVK